MVFNLYIILFYGIFVNMKTILIIGKSFSGLKNAILDQGYDYLILQDQRITKHPEKRYKRRIMADFSSKESLFATVDQIKDRVDGVVTIYESYVLPTALIAEYLHLPGLPIDAAEACTDKYKMRQHFSKAAKKISPGFAEVTNIDDLLSFARNHQYPLILKPANLAKSLLVMKNDSEEELIANYKKTIDSIEKIYRIYAPDRTPKIVIEEFMEGPIHSVDAFVDASGIPHVLEQVVDYQTGYDIGFDDNFHYSRILPSKLSSNEITQIRETAALGCKALGMKSSPAHIEIIRTKDGPMIVEIGARNGGYRERMHALANGIDISTNTLKLVLDEPLNLQATRNDACAVLELFPKNAGIFKDITNELALRKLQSLVYFAIKQNVGSFVGKSADGYKMCAVIILHNKDMQQFNTDLAYINQSVAVSTE